jgi:putative Holliday junction resolvase
LFAELVDCILEHQIQGVVIGLPLDLDGQETESSRQARNFGSSLARRIGLPIYFADEVLSSNEAERRLRQAGISLRQRQELIDQQAAVIILETFLANKDQGQQPR